MPGYWWKCEKCDGQFDFRQACGCSSMPGFIRDVLIPTGWSQKELLRPCPRCGPDSLRVEYKFPGREEATIRVLHIVGLEIGGNGEYVPNGGYVPMMWETLAVTETEPWFDFKYISGRNIFGLNKPAVLTRRNLADLLALYRKVTGVAAFP